MGGVSTNVSVFLLAAIQATAKSSMEGPADGTEAGLGGDVLTGGAINEASGAEE